MAACAYQQEDGRFPVFSRGGGELSGIGGSDLRAQKSGAFAHVSGTFLLRRARYFSEGGHPFPPGAGQGTG